MAFRFNDEATVKIVRSAGIAIAEKIKKMFEDGECDDLSLRDLNSWRESIVPQKEVSIQEAAKLVDMSVGKFYKYLDAGLFSRPRKIKGSKELKYNVRKLYEELDAIKQKDQDELKYKLRIGIFQKKRKEADDDQW